MLRSKDGFSLAEILVAAGILVIVVVGLIQLFIQCSVLSELSGNITYAMTDAQAKLDEIRNHSYSFITTDYIAGGTPGNTFDLTKGNGKGVIEIDSSSPPYNPNLLKIRIVACWKENDGRVVGEGRDINLDGNLDTCEDLNSDGKISSPVTLISFIARR